MGIVYLYSTVSPEYVVHAVYSPKHQEQKQGCVMQKHLSVPGVEAPSAQIASWQRYLGFDGGTAEDCEDIIATGHIPCVWYAIQVDKPRCVRLSEGQRLQASSH